ncbi:MAG TPA: hypothetical protein VH186_32240 [Chloroflexia bacterium]|nr:hypothetical protein [Chloroflexia bacterium]
MSYQYTLVTSFEDHWDKLGEKETSYPLRLLKGDTASSGDIFVENTPTTFIRVQPGTRNPTGVWRGTVYGFRLTTSRVFFKVKIDETLQPSDENRLEVGFYVKNVDATPGDTTDFFSGNKTTLQTTAPKTVQSDVRPAIFDELILTPDWKKFELYTYYLIKLLGIHNAYRFDPDNQSGKADGFFKFGNLAVLYDCTLRTEFKEIKRTQLENYCKQLEAGLIEAAPKVVEEFHHYQKQVWVITRGKSRLIETRNDITIKEVKVDNLIDLYEYRLRNAFTASQLENELRRIEQEEREQ